MFGNHFSHSQSKQAGEEVSQKNTSFTNRKYFRPLFGRITILCVVLVCFIPLLLKSHATSASFSNNTDVEQEDINPNEILTAVVVTRSKSGHSFFDDAHDILYNPKALTVEEAQIQVKKYEPDPTDLEKAIHQLKDLGFDVIAHNNLFIGISGTIEKFETAFGYSLTRISPGSTAYKSIHLDPERFSDSQIEGVVFLPEPSKLWAEDPTPPQGLSSLYLDDVSSLLGALPVHFEGIDGQGVSVSIFEGGLYQHPYFTKKSYCIQEASSSFSADGKADKGHGTMVASMVLATAPEVCVELDGDKFLHLLDFLTLNNDVINISQGYPENSVDEDNLPYAWIRLAIQHAIALNKIVIVGAGNSYDSYSPNWLAAIPETISVGGSGFIANRMESSEYSCSFESSIYPNTFVPDFVGLLDNLVYPTTYDSGPDHFNESELDGWASGYPGGTSASAPQIAGIVALLKQQNPDLDYLQVKEILQNTAYDIKNGHAGNGDDNCPSIDATTGYDHATGYGLVNAARALATQASLDAGWNLTAPMMSGKKASDYLLAIPGEMCTTISKWEDGRYTNLVLSNGIIFGNDYDLGLGKGYFVKCDEPVARIPFGAEYLTAETTLQLNDGWNLVSIPYSLWPYDSQRFLEEVNAETEICNTVVGYEDGAFYGFTTLPVGSSSYGYQKFYMLPGKGYFVKCTTAGSWTPSTTPPFDITTGDTAFETENTPVQPASLAIQLPEALPEISLEQTETNFERYSSMTEGIYGIGVSNLTPNSFTVYWLSDEPEMGVIPYYMDESNIGYFYDDRGVTYSGVTHHITIRDRDANSWTNWWIISGGQGYTNNGYTWSTQTAPVVDGGNSATTRIRGQFWLADGSGPVEDSFMIVNVFNEDTFDISQLSFPNVSESFVHYLDYVRTSDGQNYIDVQDGHHGFQVSYYRYGGSSPIYYPEDISSDIELPFFQTSFSVPRPPVLLSPLPGEDIAVDRPELQFVSEGSGGALQYRLELSKDNFSSIFAVYDQRTSSIGWSATSYSPGQTASFQFPEELALEFFEIVQWRVNAFDGTTWSATSQQGSFMFRPYLVYIPTVTTNNQTPSAPLSPSGLLASAINANSIYLTWQDNSSNENGFNIYDSSTLVAAVASNTTSYTVNNLNPETEYCYQVLAYNNIGNSGLSNEACATTSPTLQPPATPTNLTATALDANRIYLTWSDNSNNEDGFSISDGLSTITVGANATEYTVTGLEPNTYKCYAISAYNSAGSSVWTEWACDITLGTGDAYEPDNELGQANVINFNSTQTHSILPIADVDWVQFTLSANSQVILETSGGTAADDTRMWLYDSNGVEIEFDDDDGTDYHSYIDRVCNVDALPAGTYYVKVDEYESDEAIESYNLSLTVSSCLYSYFDDFSDPGSGWPILGDFGYQDGEYFITLGSANTRAISIKPNLPDIDYTVEADMRDYSGAGAIRYGLVFYYASGSDYYVFSVNPSSQTYSIEHYYGSTWTTIDSGSSSSIHSGTNWNHLKAIIVDNYVEIYLNDQWLGLYSGSFSNPEYVGVYAKNGDVYPLTARFDNFSVIEIP